MSKAEERSTKAYPVVKVKSVGPLPGGGISEIDMNLLARKAYLKGYHQAEKDLELTWEDMMIIHKCIKDAMNYHLYKMMEGVEGQKVVYQEVLKRFKDFRERKGEDV